MAKLGKLWEKLSNVRSRTRKGQHWLKLDVDEASGDIVINTKALKYNAAILMVVLEHSGLALQSVDILKSQAVTAVDQPCTQTHTHTVNIQSFGSHSPDPYVTHHVHVYSFALGHICCRPRQVNALFELLTIVPDNPKQSYLDAWAIRRLLGYACKRQKDVARRGQAPRATCYIFHV